MSDQALAVLVRQVARALDDFADALGGGIAGELDPSAADVAGDPAADVAGARQKQIVSLDGMAQEDGLKTAEIAEAIRYEVPNTYTTLQALARQGIVEQLPGVQPQRWRLAAKYRSSMPYLRVADHVRKGEWTTYGDISLVVRGDVMGARAVGRAAAKLSEFPYPHRVLQSGGAIPDGWRTAAGLGPEECRRRLVEEGVLFLEDGRADPRSRVEWEELRSRLKPSTPSGQPLGPVP